MTVTKQFPVLMSPSSWKRHPDCPRFVPWDFLAPHEAQARRNHDQSLIRLAERGGLDPVEMYWIVNGLPWGTADPKKKEAVMRDAVEWLVNAVKAF